MAHREAVRAVVSIAGARIRELRKSKRLSQIVLADLAGIHYNTLRRLENGSSNPSVDALVKIAETLGVTIAELFAERSPNGSL